MVEPARRHVSRGVLTRRVDPKPLAVLMVLAGAAGAVVPREALFEAVWPDTVVVDEALTRCISDLRKAFDDDPNHPRVIETIRGVGYRLIPPVAALPPPALPHRRRALGFRGRALTGLMLSLVLVTAFVSRQLEPRGERAPTPEAYPVTLIPGLERYAALSPDAAHLAFSGSSDGRAYALYVQSLPRGEPRLLVASNDAAVGPAWSPDGRRIAYLLKKDAGCTIHVTTVDGADDEAIGDCTGNYYNDLTWSPAGDWLAFSAAMRSVLPQRIILISPDGRNRRILTDPTRSRFGDHYPAFSPDGRRVGFVRTASEAASDVYVVTLDGTDEQRVTDDRRIIAGVDWWGDDELVFSSKRSGPFQLWRVRATAPGRANTPYWVPVFANNAYDPSVAIDAGALVFYADRSATNIKVAGTQNPEASQQPVLVSARYDGAPHWSPDGRRITFVSSRSGNHDVWIANADGSAPRPLTDFSGAFVDAPRWSPDGTTIAFHASPAGNQDVFLVDVERGVVTPLIADAKDDIHPRWTRNGDGLYFASDREDTWQIWHYTIATGEQRRIPVDGGGLLALDHPKAEGLLVAGPDQDGLRYVDLTTGVTTTLLHTLHEIDWGAWDATDTGLYFVRRDSATAYLSFLPFDADGPIDLGTLGGRSTWRIPWSAPVLDVSSDGGHVLFSHLDVLESEIVYLRLQ